VRVKPIRAQAGGGSSKTGVRHKRTKTFKISPHKLSAAQKRARELFVKRVRSGAFARKMIGEARSIGRKLRKNSVYGKFGVKNPWRKFSRRKARVEYKKKQPGWNRAAGALVRKRTRKNPIRSIGTPKMIVAFCVKNGTKYYLHNGPANMDPVLNTRKFGAQEFRTERAALMVMSKFKLLLARNGCSAIGSESAAHR
jgi:hypothetical protein